MIGAIYMKFKLVENFDETRSMVQEYMYDAMDELNNASLEEYIQWFKSELTDYDDEVERAVKDAYIEACDYGMIKGVEKTRLTSELKDYIDEHDDWFENNLTALYDNCPQHLQHELKIVLSKLEESLNEAKTNMKLSVTRPIYDLFRLLSIPYPDENKRISSSGQTSLKLYLLQNSGNSTQCNLDNIVVHHINGKHNDYAADNVCLLFKSDHLKLHNECFTEVIHEYTDSKGITKRKELQKLTLDDFPPNVVNELFDRYLKKMQQKAQAVRIDK